VSLYLPPAFAVADHDAIARLVGEHPFATLVTPAAPEPWISHVPLMFAPAGPAPGALVGHVARANPHWRHANGRTSVAIFSGPHAYVSPSWYRDPSQAVPTWNYATVHAHGVLEILDDPAAAREVLEMLAERFEGGRPAPWRLAMPAKQRDALVGAIVAFRLRVDRLDAKFKLSQNRPREERLRVIAGLEREARPDAAATAAWMRSHANPGDGHEPPR
jgi:transcriptional regulator